MIKLIFGNVGSGKTASVVRWMQQNTHLCIVTNIQVKKMPHVTTLKPHMILKKEIIKIKKNGQTEYDLKLNIEFWKDFVNTHKNIYVVIDEAHTFFNPRRSMSKLNIVMGDFLALLRRIIGGVGEREGKLILITQLSRRLDIYAREMATDVQYTIHHYMMRCNHCGFSWKENNEIPSVLTSCPKCNSARLIKLNNVIEVFCFKNIELFTYWTQSKQKFYYNHYYITDIHKIFKYYNTLQWDDLLSDF